MNEFEGSEFNQLSHNRGNFYLVQQSEKTKRKTKVSNLRRFQYNP